MYIYKAHKCSKNTAKTDFSKDNNVKINAVENNPVEKDTILIYRRMKTKEFSMTILLYKVISFFLSVAKDLAN